MATHFKIRKSLLKVSGVDLLRIPHTVQHRSIVEARSLLAKQRLVFLATTCVYEEMRRLWMPHYNPWADPNKKSGHRVLSRWNQFKNWFRSLFAPKQRR